MIATTGRAVRRVGASAATMLRVSTCETGGGASASGAGGSVWIQKANPAMASTSTTATNRVQNLRRARLLASSFTFHSGGPAGCGGGLTGRIPGSLDARHEG